MKLIKSYTEIETPLYGKTILKFLEEIGRVAYKSEDRITKHSAEKFIKMLIDKGHESILEHYSITVRFVCDRGVSHELVRHRIASYTQESSRYCNYSKDKFGNEITYIEPVFYNDLTLDSRVSFLNALESSEEMYFRMLKYGSSPEQARAVLPNALKTEVVATMNLRSWRHFFKLRASKFAHPDIRKLANELLEDFKANIPVIFDDIEKE
jgi:thymidylate synthase (FAD)